ncbi:hypothetical protein EUGRSUZ_H01258 [Eucalyptus grandis]|uniref:Uncharacterized protein n=2 Tax=Eucalyptus grandis TaxID=71139 RepID=A0A059AXK0_EUCGR|nr:hypothetical protein EUGRSUZ_H01258 [Eucalyptus grandis]
MCKKIYKVEYLHLKSLRMISHLSIVILKIISLRPQAYLISVKKNFTYIHHLFEGENHSLFYLIKGK